MIKILKYSFYDLVRSQWSYVYLAFNMVLGFSLLFLNHDLSKAVITLMNVITVLVPLIGTVFGLMYYYNSEEFTELLLAQPIRRSVIFIGQYLGVALALSLSLVVGLGVPFVVYGLLWSDSFWEFVLLIVTGVCLTLIFTALAFNIALYNQNRIRGFGFALLLWLFMAVIYDGLFLMSLITFEDYPLDKFSVVATLMNPIDLSRILILLRLDVSALLGYTGAVFQQFFGHGLGVMLAFCALIIWILGSVFNIYRKSGKKDF